MWSGPRNISTAMMRSWDARGDTFVTDEPLYAHYLKVTGADHPGADEVMARHECDADAVVAALCGPIPDGRAWWYQKHMAHHLLPDMDTSWVHELTNCLLVREPAAMLASLARVLPNPRLEETGLPQQRDLFRRLSDAGAPPPVIVARDVLADPPGVLGALCARLGVPYTDRMLRWAPGPRPTDGVWARHWYANVEASTGFAPPKPDTARPPARLDDVRRAAETIYAELAAHRLTA